jgi:hypothetical protein
MTQNQNSEQQSRRERIMNSDKQLPGDKERAREEEIEDFDAPDRVITGTGDAHMATSTAARKSTPMKDSFRAIVSARRTTKGSIN